MTTLVIKGPCAISGDARVPGDKSISHRGLMLGAIAHGESTLRNLAPGADVGSTMRCLKEYGVSIEHDGEACVIEASAWSAPARALDCGNSGTTMRLLAGLAAHYEFPSVFDGDASLRRRPMDRLVRPLEALGARVQTTEGHPPVRVEGGKLHGAQIETGIASAQVKSSALLAALSARGPTSVTEPAASRDHTERMLSAMGASVREEHLDDGSHRVEITPFDAIRFDLDVPGDPSSAAFLVAAAVLCGRVRIEGVDLNPTRVGFLDVLARMGAHVRYEATEHRMGEPVGWIAAQQSELASAGIEGPIVPLMLDEIPLLAVVATQARGRTTVSGAAELRVKESDRIEAMAAGLRGLGADVEDAHDGFTVRGPTPLTGSKVDGAGDHRVAMALAVAGLVAHGETHVEGFECAAVSWPGFENVLVALGAEVELR